MLLNILLGLTLAVIGFVVGSFLPLAFLLVARYAARQGFTLRGMLRVLGGSLLALVGYLVVFALIGSFLQLGVIPTELSEGHTLVFGGSVFLGFVVALIVLFRALVKGIRSARHRAESAVSS